MIKKLTFVSRTDGLKIAALALIPDGEPRAVIQLSHGVCGCKERFLPFMEYMSERGVACISSDHRGHGESVKDVKDLGYMYEDGYMALVDDLRLITDWIHSTFPSVPVYLLGHSMGSMAARVYVKYDDSAIDGLILTGSPSWNPMSKVGQGVTRGLCALGLSRMRLRLSQKLTSRSYNKSFRSEGPQSWICSDLEVRETFMNNPLCNFPLTANGSYNVLRLMTEVYSKDMWAVTNPDMPILFISGADDPLMKGEEGLLQTIDAMREKGYTNVSSSIYPGMRHEVLNEKAKISVWDEILRFICGYGIFSKNL